MQMTPTQKNEDLSLSSFEDDLNYLYEQALIEKDLSLALKIKEAQWRLFVFMKKESLTNRESLSLQDLSDSHLKDLIDQASLLLSSKGE